LHYFHFLFIFRLDYYRSKKQLIGKVKGLFIEKKGLDVFTKQIKQKNSCDDIEPIFKAYQGIKTRISSAYS
jgi:hypothetical protein